MCLGFAPQQYSSQQTTSIFSLPQKGQGNRTIFCTGATGDDLSDINVSFRLPGKN
jgi:hypothetical protein